jgi:hypothetical protein
MLSLWDNLNVSKLSHSLVQEMASLKFKPNRQNISEFDFIIIIKILTQLVKKIDKIRNNSIYAKIIGIWYWHCWS